MVFLWKVLSDFLLPFCRFLIQCICSEHGFLQRMAWETLSNLAEKVNLQG